MTPAGHEMHSQGPSRVVKNGALLAAPFVSLSVLSQGERGLLGVAGRGRRGARRTGCAAHEPERAGEAFQQVGMDTATGLKHISRIGFDCVDIFTEAMGIAEDEIDTSIEMLKDDLDACAKAMKGLIKVNRSGALVERNRRSAPPCLRSGRRLLCSAKCRLFSRQRRRRGSASASFARASAIRCA